MGGPNRHITTRVVWLTQGGEYGTTKSCLVGGGETITIAGAAFGGANAQVLVLCLLSRLVVWHERVEVKRQPNCGELKHLGTELPHKPGYEICWNRQMIALRVEPSTVQVRGTVFQAHDSYRQHCPSNSILSALSLIHI